MSFTQKIRAAMIAQCYMDCDLYGKKILDVGCGNGVVSAILQQTFALDLYGTDILDYRQRRIPFQKMDAPDRLPFPDQSFDGVFFNDVLHHSQHVIPLLFEGKRVANMIFIFEDQRSFLTSLIDIGFNYWYSPQMPCPLNFKSFQDWGSLFTQLGFTYQNLPVKRPFWWPLSHFGFKLVPGTSPVEI